MNDLSNLYIAISISDSSPGDDYIGVFFDNNHNGNWPDVSPGEDAVVFFPPPAFYDLYESSAGTNNDVNDGGTSDGSGARGTTASTNVFEFSHPLCSGDSHDFCLSAGQTVGFAVRYFHDGVFTGDWPAPVEHGSSASRWADIVVAEVAILSAWAVRTPIINGQSDCRFVFGGFDPISHLPLIQIFCDEWTDAATVSFDFKIGSTTLPSKLYLKNDLHNLYAAVQVGNDAQDSTDLIRLFFDNDNDGLAEAGDEYLHVEGDGLFFDRYFTGGSVADDIGALAGTRDGAGRPGYAVPTSTWFFEIVHPLDTTDNSHDFSLSIGATVGLGVQYFEAGSFGGAGSIFSNLHYLVANAPVALPVASRDLRITGFEVTQAVQCVDNFGSVLPACASGAPLLPLIRDKATAVRVYVDSGPDGVAPDTGSQVYLYGLGLASGQPLTSAVSVGGLVAPVTARNNGGDRSLVSHTANFILPSSWLDTDTLILKAFVKGSSPAYETNYNNNWAALVGAVANPERFYQLQRTRTLNVYVIPINTGSVAVPVLPTESQIQAQQDYMKTIFPFANVNYERGTWQQVGVWLSGSVDALNVQLETVYSQIVLARILACVFFGVCEPIPDIIYGIMGGGTGGGIARVTWCCGPGMGVAANGGDNAGGCPAPCPPLMAHEINHDLDKVNGDGETLVYSSDGDSIYDAGEPLIDGIIPPVGTVLEDDPKIKYVDNNGNLVWNAGEAVVYSSDGDSTYDSGEPVITGTTPAGGTSLRDDAKVKFVDARDNNAYDQGSWGRHVSGPRTTDPLGTPSYGCGAGGPNTRWPWADDDIHEYGLDTRSLTVYVPTATDLMSYCWSSLQGGPPWVSGYRWNSLFDTFQTGMGASPLPLGVVPGESVLLSGHIPSTGGGQIDSVLRLPGQTGAQPGAGSYSVELLDGQGAVLASQNFEPVFEDVDGGKMDPFLFSLLLPFPANTMVIQLMQGQTVLDRVVPTRNPPSVLVRSPNGGETLSRGVHTINWEALDLDGDALTYNVQYSTDAGITWVPIGTNLVLTSLDFDFGTVPGTSKAMIRVMASDGFYTSTDSSDGTFSVQDGPPLVHILAPVNGTSFDGVDTIILQGEGFDLEDGILAGVSLEWASDLDGFLGTGDTLSSALSFGFHKITLTATDSVGNKASSSISINVLVPNRARLFELDWSDYDNNGRVEIIDVASAALVFNKPSSYWDFDLNDVTDIVDISRVALLFGQSFGEDPYPSKGLPDGIMDPGWSSLCSSLPPMDQAYCTARI